MAVQKTSPVSAGRYPGQAKWPKRLQLERLDAAENAFFLRELEHISAKLYKRQYFELKGREIVPSENEGMSPGDQSFTYRGWDYVGEAVAIADYSADLPMVNIKGEEVTQRLQAYGSGYSYSLEEIAAAAKLNRPLESDRAMICKEVMDQKLDQICAVGDGNYKLQGILNLSNTRTPAPGVKASGGVAWLDANSNLVATADEVLKDLNLIVRDQANATGGVEKPNRIVMPVAHMQAISSTARSPVSDTTIKEFFEANNPGIELMEWERLLQANYTAGSSSLPANPVSRLLGYRADPMKVKLLMALEFTQEPPERRNLAFMINAWQKTGGVICPYPQSVSYMDGC